MSELIIGFCIGLMVVTSWPAKFDGMFDSHYVLPKSEYNELRQDGKVWAYVRKDGKL